METKTLKDLESVSKEVYDKIARAKRHNELAWYALYVTPQHERKMLEALTGVPDPYARKSSSPNKNDYPLLNPPIEAFVPLRKERHKWSDRVKIVPVVLTPSIVFVRIKLEEYQRRLLQQYPHAHRFIYNKEKKEPSRISDTAMFAFRKACEDESLDISMIEPIPGDTVKILVGSMKGFVGEIVRIEGKDKFQLRLSDYIAATFTVNKNDVAQVPVGTLSDTQEERLL